MSFIGFRRTLPQNFPQNKMNLEKNHSVKEFSKIVIFAALIHILVNSRNAMTRSFYNTYLFISTFLGLASAYD